MSTSVALDAVSKGYLVFLVKKNKYVYCFFAIIYDFFFVTILFLKEKPEKLKKGRLSQL
jgi:hypothetical protein